MLKNKTILVVGGFGLLGEEFSKLIIKKGARLIIGDIKNKVNMSKLDRLATASSNNKLSFIELDITNEKSIKNSFELLHKLPYKIDSVVNTSYPRNKFFGKKFLEVSLKDFNENLSMHLGGYFSVAQNAIKLFLKQGHGNLINLASIYGIIPPKFEIYEGTQMTMPVEYAAIKSGIIHLTRYMAKYLKGKNIRVNSISPGGIKNNQDKKFEELYRLKTINKGMLDSSDLNGTLLFLLSDMGEFINGQNLIIDDGFSL